MRRGAVAELGRGIGMEYSKKLGGGRDKNPVNEKAGAARLCGPPSNGKMRQRTRPGDWILRSLALGALLTAIAAAGQPAQGSCTFTDENGKVVTLPNCGIPAAGTPARPSPAASGAAKSFPYPGDSSAGAGTSGNGNGLPAGPGAATAPAGPQPPANGQTPAASGGSGADSNLPASKRFPFPGDDSSGSGTGSAAGANAAAPGGLQDAGSSGASSSSDSSSSTSSSSDSNSGLSGNDNGAGPLPGDNDPAARAAAEKHRERLPAAPVQTNSEREQEDIRVAEFYQNDQDYRGAYMRAKDAVSLADDDAEAHLALAEAARKLGKLDEAEANYKKCLTLDPVPKVRKAAEKALKEMQGG